MAQNEATIPLEALAGLDVKEGDVLTVTRRSLGSITLAARVPLRESQMRGAEFCTKLAALDIKLPVDLDTSDDPRLDYLIEKQVK